MGHTSVLTRKADNGTGRESKMENRKGAKKGGCIKASTVGHSQGRISSTCIARTYGSKKGLPAALQSSGHRRPRAKSRDHISNLYTKRIKLQTEQSTVAPRTCPSEKGSRPLTTSSRRCLYTPKSAADPATNPTTRGSSGRTAADPMTGAMYFA